MDLSFLKNVQLKPIEVKTVGKRTTSTEPKNPLNADIRVYANGTVFPSKALVEEFNLEYIHRDAQDLSNGFDIFSSLKWGMIMGQLPSELIFIAASKKGTPKLDLFSSCRYEEDGTPKASVIDQGMSAFCKDQFLPMLSEVYKIDWTIVKYVDLQIQREEILRSPNQVYHLPKVVSSGPHKGKDDYVTRELITINPLTIAHIEFKDGFSEQDMNVVAEVINAPATSEKEEEFARTIIHETQDVSGSDTDVDLIVGTPDPNAALTFNPFEEGTRNLAETPLDIHNPFNVEVNANDPGEDWANDLGKK